MEVCVNHVLSSAGTAGPGRSWGAASWASPDPPVNITSPTHQPIKIRTPRHIKLSSLDKCRYLTGLLGIEHRPGRQVRFDAGRKRRPKMPRRMTRILSPRRRRCSSFQQRRCAFRRTSSQPAVAPRFFVPLRRLGAAPVGRHHSQTDREKYGIDRRPEHAARSGHAHTADC